MCTRHGRSATAWRWLSVCFWQSIYVWGPVLSIRIFSHYLHLPIFLLALADWVVLMLAVYLANALLPDFDPAASYSPLCHSFLCYRLASTAPTSGFYLWVLCCGRFRAS